MSTPTPPNDLAGLLAERDRDSTPPAVFEKVQRDYTARLDGVVGQLRERDRELEQRAVKLAAELAGVEGHQRARQEARSEAELRHLVGEYTEAEWATVAAESDAELVSIDAKRAECARDHQAALELLSAVRRPVGTPADVPVTVPAPAPRATPATVKAVAAAPPRVAPVTATTVSAAPARPSVPRAAVPTPNPPMPVVTAHDSGKQIHTPATDELAFLSSLAADVARRSGISRAVTSDQATQPVPMRAPAPAAPAPAPAAHQPRVSRPVAAEHVAPPPPAAPRALRPTQAEPAPMPAPELRRSSIPSTLTPADGHAMPAENAALTDADVNPPRTTNTFGVPSAPAPRVTSRDSASILRRAQGEHVKSLKCAECGTLNLPTEWYCEKCGAELSAL